MKVIGLTGGIACGKSTVAGMLRELGAWIVDADDISRSLTRAGGRGLEAIRRAFGDEVFQGDALDRAKLGNIVFSNEQKRETLNGILHPMIRMEMLSQVAAGRKAGAKVVVLDVPLLFEAGMQDMAQLVVCVHVPESVQIARIQSRDGLDGQQAVSRIRSQMPLGEKMRLSDVLLPTDKPLEELNKDVIRLYQSWIDA